MLWGEKRVSRCLIFDLEIFLTHYLGEKTRSEKRQLKGLSLLLFRKKSKRTRGEKPEEQTEEAAQQAIPTVEVPAAEEAPAVQETPAVQEPPAVEEAPVAATSIEPAAIEPTAIEPTAHDEREARADDQTEDITTTTDHAAASKVSTVEEHGPSTVFAAGPAAPIAAPVRLVTTGPSEPESYAGVPQRDAAATAGTNDMHIVRPITSPRADAKLKNWFRDRLVRRSSGPVPVYPHQPGPDFQSGSEIGFTGGAALTSQGRGESRGAALSSHPILPGDGNRNDNELDQSPTSHNGGTFLEMSKSTTGGTGGESISSSTRQNGNGSANGNGKRQRLRKSFMKLSRKEGDAKSNGFTKGGGHSRQNSETKVSGTGEGLQNLRHSATEQGLPAPPILGQTASTGRESRFSEDL